MQRILNYKPTPEQIAESERLEAERAKEEAERKEQERERFLSRIGVPRRYRSFKRPSAGPWLETFQNIRSMFGSGCIVVLTGIRGTGKTQMACELVQEFGQMVRHRDPQLFPEGRKGGCGYPWRVKSTELFLRIRETYSKRDESESDVIDDCVCRGLLILDAMEERKQSDAEDHILDHIIDKRYSELLDTIIISNETRDAMKKSLGPSIVSRIHESGEVIEFNWQSFRGKK
jgi:DNA replication protein DnaC